MALDLPLFLLDLRRLYRFLLDPEDELEEELAEVDRLDFPVFDLRRLRREQDEVEMELSEAEQLDVEELEEEEESLGGWSPGLAAAVTKEVGGWESSETET